ncbi:MAG: SOS response-associated peptidase [Acidobacteria bacterium]|nr:SOS response-associated peptidase [Acidobacteriota bacterium]
MCGRYTLHHAPAEIGERFDVEVVPELAPPRFNIAPTQIVPVIRQTDGREMVGCKWGLVPSWAKDPAIGNKMINARSETLASKPSFKNALAKRRCLIPADGFYEWLKAKKQPFYFRLRDRGLFALAGLWEEWIEPGSGEPLQTCTIITVEPNKLVAQVHQRMPALLLPDEEAIWLDPDHKAADVLSLLRPYPVEKMELVPVSRAVNSASAQGPELIEQVNE